jgi:hypothetical protein
MGSDEEERDERGLVDEGKHFLDSGKGPFQPSAYLNAQFTGHSESFFPVFIHNASSIP